MRGSHLAVCDCCFCTFRELVCNSTTLPPPWWAARTAGGESISQVLAPNKPYHYDFIIILCIAATIQHGTNAHILAKSTVKSDTWFFFQRAN